MAAVGASPKSLAELAAACERSAEELATTRRGIEATLLEACEYSDVPGGIREVESWLKDQAHDLRRRAEELGEADRRTNPATAFGRGIRDGIGGLVGGVRGLVAMAYSPVIDAWRLADAVVAHGVREGARRHGEAQHQRSEETLRGLRAAFVDGFHTGLQFNPATAPGILLWRIHRDGARPTVEAYAYDIGTIVPEIALTLATLGAGRALRAARLAPAPGGKSAFGVGDVSATTGTAPSSVGALRRLEYEPSPKHGQRQRGRISAAPRDGQASLYTSFKLGPNTTRRIAPEYETGQFVVFDETRTGYFHGHVRSWRELDQVMKNVLLRNELVNRKGRLL